MDFDNIIYVVAIIAWLLYSFFGKKKKKESRAPAENFPIPSSETPAPKSYSPPAAPVSKSMRKKKSESGKTIFEEIIKSLEGEIPVETIFSEEEPSELKPSAGNKEKPSKGKTIIYPGKYDTLESTESLEVYPQAESLEDLYKKEKPAKVTAKPKKTAGPAAKQIEKEENVAHQEINWREAFIYSEIIGRPRALNTYEYLR